MRFKDSELYMHELAVCNNLQHGVETDIATIGVHEGYPLMRLHLKNVDVLPDMENVFKNCPLVCSLVVQFSTSMTSKDRASHRGLTLPAAHRIGDYLRFSQCLLVISISGANISDEILRALMGGLQSCMQLVELDLSRNHISDEGAFLLSHLLGHEYCLNILNLEQNDISRQGCFHLSLTLAPNITLETLNLSLNPVGDTGAGDILRCLCMNTCLNHLAVSCCNLTNSSLPFVAILLAENKSLAHLDLSGNPMGSDLGVAHINFLLEAISRNQQIDLVDVRGCDFPSTVADNINAKHVKLHAFDRLLPG